MSKEEFFSPAAIEGFLPNVEGFAEGPERELLRALLFDGIQAYFSYSLNNAPVIKEKFKEAYYWVHARDSEYVFSFQSVCEGLGLNPDSLRLGISNFVNSNQIEEEPEVIPDYHAAEPVTPQANWRRSKRRQL